MYYTGFADEAGGSIDAQIQATLELGWSNIEARSVDGVNLTDISDQKFEQVYEKLAAAGVRVNCLGSTIANWSRDPRSEEDFQYSVEALQRAIPRMHRLGTTMIRGMSFAVVRDGDPDSPELEAIIFEKVRHLVRMCEEAGVLYLHENCMNYGGMSHEHTLRLLDNVRSPNCRLVFDTGNPVFTDRRSVPSPIANSPRGNSTPTSGSGSTMCTSRTAATSGRATASSPRSSTPFPAKAMATWSESSAIYCTPATTAACPSSRTCVSSTTTTRPNRPTRSATTTMWYMAGA